MKYVHYNPGDEYNCVIRSISKTLNKPCIDVLNELKSIDEDYSKIKVLDKYLVDNGFYIDESLKDNIIENINLLDGINILFVYKGDWYHFIAVIDNVIYDKSSYEEIKDMKVIKIYKLK